LTPSAVAKTASPAKNAVTTVAQSVKEQLTPVVTVSVTGSTG
jgi:hypothetical protein